MKKTNLKILVIGAGGREHALVWKIKQSPLVSKIYITPGNAGTAQLGQNLTLQIDQLDQLVEFAFSKKIDLTVVGSEVPLAKGIVDRFEAQGLTIFGPNRQAAKLEASKSFASKFLAKYRVPQPWSESFSDYQSALEFIQKYAPQDIVIKTSGLAAGKGVFLPQTIKDVEFALRQIMKDRIFGKAGNKVVIQERLKGQELSVLVFTDGQTVVLLPPAQDHKQIGENDTGPNTGGMGAVAPVPSVSKSLLKEIKKTIFQPTIDGIRAEGSLYKGILYAGLMITSDGPKVLEFNCRFGDPETQPQMMLLKSDLIPIMQACIERNLNSNLVKFKPGAAACVILTSSGYPRRYETGKIITGLEKLSSKQIQIFHAGTKLQKNKVLTNGGRVLGVTAYAPHLKQALDKVYQQVEKIKFENKYYRRDINHKSILLNLVHRIEITAQKEDARAKIMTQQISNFGFHAKLNGVWLTDVYSIDKTVTKKQLQSIAKLLTNPITQLFSIDAPACPEKFSWAIEVGLLPGVTDNLAATAQETISDGTNITFSSLEKIYTSQIYFLSGSLTKKDAQTIAAKLINPLIGRASLKSFKQFQQDQGMERVVPRITLKQSSQIDQVDLNLTDRELIILSKKGILNADGTRRGPLALDLVYLKTIRRYFAKLNRNPTDIELESLAQTWSEHCKHTIFADPIDELKDGLYKSYIQKATQEIRKKKGKQDFCVSVFTDNSGAIIFNDDYLVTDKVETHNSPSALDPFGGSITGIVGVNRDTIGFGLGAKPILNRYGFCFADPRARIQLYKDPGRTQKMLSSARIIEGVIKGVNVGGNQSGIPTPQGFVYFDKSYSGKPLVFVGTVGLIPKKKNGRKLYRKQAQNGDYIVMLGGRVGKDGIHGATFSSEAMDSGSPATAVQIGDPITQKKLSDAVLKEARDLGLYNSITDNGAGGLSCSVAEMAQESGGCEVNLDKVPLKYAGLAPWEIWISESQERMTLAVPVEKWQIFSSLMQSRGVEATRIGTFNDGGKCVVKNKGKIIVNLDLDFLHHGLPARKMKTSLVKQKFSEPNIPILNNLNFILKRILRQPNIAGFNYISNQFDYEVQAGSVLKPIQGKGLINADATVIKPILSSNKGVVVSQGICPAYSPIDTYHMAACAIDTAIRNVIAVGGSLNSLALLDNFCWCSSTEPERLAQLKQAAQACYDYATVYETPFISGKDSMFNDFKGFDQAGKPLKISIQPTLLISAISVIDDVCQVVSLEPKFAGDLVYILGETFEELGGSEYFRLWNQEKNNNKIGNAVPKVNAAKNKKLYLALSACIRRNLVASSLSLGRGGLAVGLAKLSMAGKLGVKVSLKNLPGKFKRNDYALFSESQGRILLTINPQNKIPFEKIMLGNSFAQIGEVSSDSTLTIQDRRGNNLVCLNFETALAIYHRAFGEILSAKVKAMILTGYGINCEQETAHAFALAGATTDIVHINDLISGQFNLHDYQILAFPGGFSYGDDLGSGRAFANKVRNQLGKKIETFIKADRLVIGICNGFQILVNLGLLPAIDGHYRTQQAALVHNDNARYTVRWVDLEVSQINSPWLNNITKLSMPIAHGEGKFFADENVLAKLNQKKLIALRYVKGEMCHYQDLEVNPNGSCQDIAGLVDPTGRILGLMPHPERALFFTHLPNWPLLKEQFLRTGKKLPKYGPGLSIFCNAVEYFKENY